MRSTPASLCLAGLLLFLTQPISAQHEKSHEHAEFGYSGDAGPGFWGEINPACAVTSTSRQSPIDIADTQEDKTLKPLDTHLGETTYTLKDNGHSLMATPASGGTLTLNGTTFKLQQFHFHTLSEHTIKGEHADMELHAVFQDAKSNLAVIGVLYRVGQKDDLFLAKLISAGLPEKISANPVTVSHLDLANAFTDLSSYFTYPGSLTTPPCSETVTWLVLSQPAELSASQFEEFRKVLGNNFRPVQPRNGRTVLVSAGKSKESD